MSRASRWLAQEEADRREAEHQQRIEKRKADEQAERNAENRKAQPYVRALTEMTERDEIHWAPDRQHRMWETEVEGVMVVLDGWNTIRIGTEELHFSAGNLEPAIVAQQKRGQSRDLDRLATGLHIKEADQWTSPIS